MKNNASSVRFFLIYLLFFELYQSWLKHIQNKVAPRNGLGILLIQFSLFTVYFFEFPNPNPNFCIIFLTRRYYPSMIHKKMVRLSHTYSAVLLIPKTPCRNLSAQMKKVHQKISFYLKDFQIVIFTPERAFRTKSSLIF